MNAQTNLSRLWLPAAGLLITLAAGGMGWMGYRLAQEPAELAAHAAPDNPSVVAAGKKLAEMPANQRASRSMSHLALPELRLKLADPVALTLEDKRAVADALIDLGTEEALQAWGQALLAEKDPSARAAMLEALDMLTGELAVEMITQLVAISDAPEILDAVARTLSRMANRETVKYLTEIHAAAAPGDDTQERVLRVLGTITNPTAIPGLIEVALQPALGADLTGQAFKSLGTIGNPDALDALTKAYDALSPDDFAQRRQVLDAIATIRNPDSSVILQSLAEHNHQPLIAGAAEDALNLMKSSLAADLSPPDLTP